jgi:hypothetical protein
VKMNLRQLVTLTHLSMLRDWATCNLNPIALHQPKGLVPFSGITQVGSTLGKPPLTLKIQEHPDR